MQTAKAPPSRPQAKVLLASVDVKLKFAPVLLLGLLGVAVIVVSGAAVSMVQVKLAGVKSVLLVPSVARTWKVWLPSVREL